MGFHFRSWAGFLALFFLAASADLGHADPGKKEANPRQASDAVRMGLDFVQKDAAKWRKERQCSTCHHGTLTVWALSEAKSQGYPIPAETLKDTVKWTKDRLLERIDLPRDTRPGWSMVSTPAIYLAAMSLCVPAQDAVSPEELKRIAKHLFRHQEDDGSWSWASAPPKNRPPPFFESDEVATLLGYAALGSPSLTELTAKGEGRASREKSAAWLLKAKPNDTTQAEVMRLFVKVREGEAAKNLLANIQPLLARQNQDGGWGQVKDAASDAYATGQALYVLAVAGVKKDQAEVRRGVAFLVGSQKEDGSWAIAPRSHPGATPAKNTIPITYFGSAWATLGLLRSVQK